MLEIMSSREQWRWLLRGILVLIALGAVVAFFLSGAEHHLDFATLQSSREWLALNMMTEAKAGFRAFNEGPKHDREIDFVKLRQLLAEGAEWNEEMLKSISPQYKTETV